MQYIFSAGKEVSTNSIPQIRLVFILSKNDSTDFDWDSVTQRLCITPSKASAPTLCNGRLYSDADICEVERELPGLTILPASSPPYQVLKHAYWSIELPKIECWELDKPLRQLEQILLGKGPEVLHICKDYNLSANLIVRVICRSLQFHTVVFLSGHPSECQLALTFIWIDQENPNIF